ncbi:MAG: metallophosphoesterase [Actinomycetota bacterium]|nr:metallophosphoesterase [Actinomycetota bacterium]
MPTRILHVSDLHVGSHEELRIEPSLVELIRRVDPELVLATGDLTHRGRSGQHERAARLLKGLALPVLAIPGNHDIPYTFPARFTRPWLEFERHWQTTEPTYSSDTIFAIGLNSVRPWRQQSGGVSDEQLERALERLRRAPERALKIVALHHQMVGAPWRSRKKPVARRNHVLAKLVDCGAELVVGGHIHQATVCERHEFELATNTTPGVVVSIAPGLGQPRPHRRGEARGLHAYEVGRDSLRVETYVWRDGEWGLTAERVFPRGREPLAREAEL